MIEATGKCSTCEFMWIHQSIQPCRGCKECSGYGGTADNYSTTKKKLETNFTRVKK